MAANERQCATCDYSHFDDGLTLTGSRGQCRARTPHPKHGWPLVFRGDWCGWWDDGRDEPPETATADSSLTLWDQNIRPLLPAQD